MMYTKEDIVQLAGDLERCRKILLALGDENISFHITSQLPDRSSEIE